MSPLNDLHRRLYSHNNKDLIDRSNSSDEYNDEKEPEEEDVVEQSTTIERNPLSSIILPDNQEKKMLQPEKINNRTKKGKIKIIGVVFSIVLLFIGGIIGYIKYKQGSFDQENVVIEFQGIKETKSGESFEYDLLINNNNRVALKNTRIKIEYPEELIPVMMNYISPDTTKSFFIEVGDIKPQEIKTYKLEFKVFSVRGGQVYLKTDFRYEPANFSSVFNKEGNHFLLIRGAAVNFSLVSQQEAASGELLKTIAVLINTTNDDLNNLVLKVEYPEGFSTEKSSLEKINGVDDQFKIPALKANTKLEVEILGTFVGAIDSIKKLVGTVGVIDDNNQFRGISLAEETVKVIPSRIVINQNIISGIDIKTQTTYLGSLLQYEVDFKNNSTNPLSDLIVIEELDSDLIEASSVKVTGGYYDQAKREIIWKASDIPALENLNPGEKGKVKFEFGLKRNTPLDDNNTNQAVITQAKISSLNINTSLLNNKEINSGNREIKINTNLDILVSGEFGGGAFKNNGPIPVEVGQETTFTIKLVLRNNFNKIDGPNLLINLPSGITWKNSFQRSSGNVSFNERSNQLKWDLNSIDPQTGYKHPSEELNFQVGVNPEYSLAGGDLTLLNSINFKGFENFVDKEINQDLKEFKLSSISDYEF